LALRPPSTRRCSVHPLLVLGPAQLRSFRSYPQPQPRLPRNHRPSHPSPSPSPSLIPVLYERRGKPVGMASGLSSPHRSHEEVSLPPPRTRIKTKREYAPSKSRARIPRWIATVSMLRASLLPSLFLLRLISRSAGPETPQSNPLIRSSQLARSAPIESSPHSPYRPTITASRLSPRSSPADLSRGY
jgi:hypothetical protein